MKILHVLSDIRVDSGAIAASACGMAAAAAAREHDVTIACVKHEGAALQPQGVLVRSFAPDRKAKRMASTDLRTYLQQNVRHVDIVHIHGLWHHPGHYAATAARQAKIPYILTPHGLLEDGVPAAGGPLSKSINWLLRDSAMVHHAAAIQCLNISEMKHSSALAGLKKTIIGNGIPAAVCENLPARGSWRAEIQATLVKPDRPLALFFGRIEPKKGLERLLPHWPALLKEQPDLLLVIAGTGDKASIDELNALITRHHLTGHVVWTGDLTGLAKWRTLVDCDVFIFPAHQADASPAITEAMAAGLPVVLTRECHFDEVEEHHAGVIIEHGDMAAFVRSVSELMGNTEIRNSMGLNGQKLVQSHFTWEVTGEKLERLYEALALHTDIPLDLLPPRDNP
jgi:glycosyltransferase involved in cell wall biosynthesis